MKYQSITVSFELRDAWIGVYWNVWSVENSIFLDIYICLLPFFPITLSFREDNARIDK